MIDETWRLFSKTGNIEAYLLLKELENSPNEAYHNDDKKDEIIPFDAKM